MLKFNSIIVYTNYFKDYLNTSYVKVQHKDLKKLYIGKTNLNTSYVKVQHKKYKIESRGRKNLNTSYVKVQLSKTTF